MENSSSSVPRVTSAAEFVTELFRRWKNNRQSLETKWQKNWDHVTGVSSEVWKSGEGQGWRSRTFLPATKQKVMSGYALVIDMELQDSSGDIPFELKVSPMGADSVANLPVEQAQGERESVLAMQRLIKQQLSDCNADRALMRNVMSGAIYGETYAKRYVFEVNRQVFVPTVVMQPDPASGQMVPVVQGMTAQTISRKSPGWEYITLWDIFRDLETEDLQESSGIIHRQFVCRYDLVKMKDQDYFDDEAIDRVLAMSSGPGRAANLTDTSSSSPGRREIDEQEKNIEVLEFWGRIPAKTVTEYLTQLDAAPGDEEDDSEDEIEVMVVVVGNEVIRFSVVDHGDRPFYRAVWDIDLDGLGGRGIADNVSDLQVSINGAMRAYEDNKKLSGNVMIATKDEYLEHPDKLKEFHPGMRIPISPDCKDVRMAIQPVVIPDVANSLLDAISMYERYIDENSMIPKVSQGINAKEQITAYEISQLVENAGKYMGAVIRNFDEGLIEPMVAAFLKYNMVDPDLEVPPLNLSVKAMGFTTYNNKIIRVQKLMQFMQLIAQTPGMEREYDNAAIVGELAKAMGMDLELFRKSDEQKQKEAEAEENDYNRKLELARAEAEIKHKVAQADKWTADAERARGSSQLDRAKFGREVRKDVDAAAGGPEMAPPGT